MQELIDKRTARSKTWLLDDGVTHRLQVGGDIAHHQKNGAWVDTICNWQKSATEFLTGEWPGQLKVNEGTRAITILPQGATVPVTIAPLGHDRKAPAPTYAGNCITFVGLWTGVDLRVYLTPEGLSLQYTKTAAVCDDPAWTLPDDAAAFMQGGETYQGSIGPVGAVGPVAVPTTLQYGQYTLDFSAVPVGVVVS